MNENINLYIAEINKKMIAYSNQKIRLDIEVGKMGYSLYFFKIARLLCEPRQKKQAEKLLADIYLELANESTIRTTSELAQIGIGIDYLVRQKYVEGNPNSILGDIDKLIFRAIVFNDAPITYRMDGVVPILYFICMRIKEQNKRNDIRFMLEELCIKLFNNFYQSLDSGFYDEPYLFNILDYKLPQFLYVVSKMYSLQFYNYRIVEVLKEMSSIILSRMPVLHANRLYLLWSLVHLKKATGWNVWDEQMDILANHIDYQKIIYIELRNKDVFISDGIAGIYLILNALKDTPHSVPFDGILFRKRIEESMIWIDEEAFKNLGLFYGFSGLFWVYYLITNEQ